jgi:hypothetical protein
MDAEADMGRARVLVVGEDCQDLREVREWLSQAGFVVLASAESSAPGYGLAGSAGWSRLLAEEADVVVLDPSLDSDAVLEGVGAVEIVGDCLFRGTPVAAFRHHPDAIHPFSQYDVTFLDWPPRMEEVVEAVSLLTRRALGRTTALEGGPLGMDVRAEAAGTRTTRGARAASRVNGADGADDVADRRALRPLGASWAQAGRGLQTPLGAVVLDGLERGTRDS